MLGRLDTSSPTDADCVMSGGLRPSSIRHASGDVMARLRCVALCANRKARHQKQGAHHQGDDRTEPTGDTVGGAQVKLQQGIK